MKVDRKFLVRVNDRTQKEREYILKRHLFIEVPDDTPTKEVEVENEDGSKKTIRLIDPEVVESMGYIQMNLYQLDMGMVWVRGRKYSTEYGYRIEADEEIPARVGG